MQLTAENYYSPEANYEYMSVSQFKDFAGTYGQVRCEALAMAKLRGEYQEEKTTALLVGSYVDAYFEGTLDKFKMENPEIFTKTSQKKYPGDPEKWELLSDYKQANNIIARIERDEFFMAHMAGQKQVIMTGELFGLPWKIKIDSYLEGIAIVDLKVMASLTKHEWVRDIGYLDFVRYWGYDIQAAVYQEIVYQNTGKRLPFYIAGASKEKATNIKIVHVQDNYLQEAMNIVKYNIERVKLVKYGEVIPDRCGNCDYCRETEVLTAPITISDLVADI